MTHSVWATAGLIVLLRGTWVELRFHQQPHVWSHGCWLKYKLWPFNNKVIVPQLHVCWLRAWLLFSRSHPFGSLSVTLSFRGRVSVLDFGTMRVCDLEFDCVRRLTTPPSPLPAATPNPTPSCHTVWKYYCRDNFGWREYSEVSHSLHLCVFVRIHTLSTGLVALTLPTAINCVFTLIESI